MNAKSGRHGGAEPRTAPGEVGPSTAGRRAADATAGGRSGSDEGRSAEPGGAATQPVGAGTVAGASGPGAARQSGPGRSAVRRAGAGTAGGRSGRSRTPSAEAGRATAQQGGGERETGRSGRAEVRLTELGRWTAGAGTVGLVLGGAGGWSPVFALGAVALTGCVAAWTSLRVGRHAGVVADPPPAPAHVRGEPLAVAYAPDGPSGRTAPLVVHGALHSTLPGPPDGEPEGIAVRGRGWSAEVPALPRGVWRLGPAVAEYRDALGLAVRRTAPSPASAPFTVRPRTVADLPWVAEAHAAHSTGAARLDTDEAFEIHGSRPYTPGDDLRLLDWRGTLLAGSFQVRELRGGGSAPTVVLLDPATGGEAFETAVDCAASVAVSVLASGRPVVLGGVGAAGESPRRVDPAPGAADDVLDLFARLRPRAGTSSAALARLAATAGGGALAVLATPADPAQWRPLLSALSARWATMLCLHASPGGAPPPAPRQAPGFRVLRVTSLDDLTSLDALGAPARPTRPRTTTGPP